MCWLCCLFCLCLIAVFGGVCRYISCCNVCVAVILVMPRCLRSLFVMPVAYLSVLVVLLVLFFFAMFDGLCCCCFVCDCFVL